MMETTTNLDVMEMIGDKTTGAAVKASTFPTPLILATIEDIHAGSVLIKSDARLPESLHFAPKQHGAWKVLTDANGFEVERRLSEVGWHFFFMVPEIKIAALSFNRNQAIRTALKRVFAAVDALELNALEIVKITAKRILGLHYVTIVAHARHAKNNPYLRDLDPSYIPRNVWNFKGVLRRRSQIGRMRKGI